MHNKKYALIGKLIEIYTINPAPSAHEPVMKFWADFICDEATLKKQYTSKDKCLTLVFPMGRESYTATALPDDMVFFTSKSDAMKALKKLTPKI